MVSGEHTFSADIPSGWQPGTVAVPGGHLAYHRTGGSGPSLLLSHGLTDNGLCWSRVAKALEADYDIIMLDARGHGESSRLRAGEDHDPARDIAEAIVNLDLKSPIVMGHSVGALAIAACANAHPHLVAKVILEDPPFGPSPDRTTGLERQNKFRKQVAEFQRMSEGQITDMGRRLSPDWHLDEFPAWARGKRQVDPEAMPVAFAPWSASIDKISAPTLLIYGEAARGALMTTEVAAEAMRINPCIRAVPIEGAGHNVRRENFDGFLAVVSAFLDENESRECKT